MKPTKQLGDLSNLEQEEVISILKEIHNSDLEFEYEGFLFGVIKHKSRINGEEKLYFYTKPDLVNFGKTEKEREEFRKKINIEVLWIVKELLKNNIPYAYGCICCNEILTSYEEVLEHILLTNFL